MPFDIMSAPNHQNGNYELPTGDNDPLPGLPEEMNEGADIGEEAAVQEALLTRATYGAINPTVQTSNIFFNKAYVILRASYGFLLGYTLTSK